MNMFDSQNKKMDDSIGQNRFFNLKWKKYLFSLGKFNTISRPIERLPNIY